MCGLFNDGQHNEAEKFLDKVTTNNFDPIIYAQAIFWKAEIAYRRADYATAQKGYALFLSLEQAVATEEYPMAFYNQGYTEFKLKQYRSALNRFLQFQKLESQVKNTKIISDAYNRTGDCYFMLSELNNAKIQYQKVIDVGLYDVDYALYQLAQTEGGMRQFDTKIKTMKLLEENIQNHRILLMLNMKSQVLISHADKTEKPQQPIRILFKNIREIH